MMLQGSMPGAAAEWNRTVKRVILSEGEVIFVVIAAQIERDECVCVWEGGLSMLLPL